MAPVSQQEARLRKAVLSLAKETEFGKRMVNGGRLSVPSVYDTPLSTADRDAWRGGPRPAAPMREPRAGARPGIRGFWTKPFTKAGARFTGFGFGKGRAVAPPEGVATTRVGGGGGL